MLLEYVVGKPDRAVKHEHDFSEYTDEELILHAC